MNTTNTNTRTEPDERLNTADLAARSPHAGDAPEPQQGARSRDDRRQDVAGRPDDRGTHVAAPEQRVEPDSREFRQPDTVATPTPSMAAQPVHQGAAQAPQVPPAAPHQASPVRPGGASQTPPFGGHDATPLLASGL